MSQMHTLAIKEIRRETKDTVSIAFDIPESLHDNFSFESGQYLTLETEINKEKVRRSYSLCSAPTDQEWRVAIKKVEGGKFSTYANEQLTDSEYMEVLPPMGNFKLTPNKDVQQHHVGFAAGSGITPILSMIKTVLRQEPQSKFTLFYGNKNFDSIIFREEIEALKNLYLNRLSVHHILSREKLGSPLFYGRINGEKCTKFADVFFEATTVAGYYLCGPADMIFDVKDSLLACGASADNIHFELFNTSGLSKKETEQSEKADFDPSKESRVTVILDGDSFDFNLAYGGVNILDAALAEGADLPYACKGGVCCTCKAKIDQGAVDMDVNYTLEPDEIDAGFVLTCQAHPRTPRTIVNFDEA